MTVIDAIILHLGLQLGAVLLGWRLARSVSDRVRPALLLAAMALLALAIGATTGPWLLRLCPIRDLALVGNQVPLAAGLLGGMALATPRLALWRRRLVLGLMLVVADVTSLAPLTLPVPQTLDLWQDGTCVQTTDATCAPAAAATLLRLHGIHATEGELAAWCLTTSKGTTRWGLWRGLRALTDGSEWTVQAEEGPVETVLGRGPAIISVMLTKDLDRRDVRYRTKWGWLVDQPHAVIYLGPSPRPGYVLMSDPKTGNEVWEEEGLRALWNGQVFRLVRRPGAP